MPRFSLRALLALVFFAAIVCAVLLGFSVWLRVSSLFIGVLAMPGPLAILARSGNPSAKTFGVGGFIAYAAWFIVVAVPGGFAIATLSASFSGTIKGLADEPVGLTIEQLSFPAYLYWSTFYAPWLIVPLAGVTALLVRWIVEKPHLTQNIAAKNQ